MKLPIFLLMLAPAAAQTPAVGSSAAAASAEDSRLRQMEGIYLQQLRVLHVPLLGSYVTELQRLAAQAPDPAPYQREITRIQGVISSGGVVDLAGAVQSLKAPAEPPDEPGAPPVPRLRRGAITLTPGLAARILPVPDSSASPEAAAIGEIEWRIESLAAGTYEVILNYACPALVSELPLRLQLGSHEISARLDSSRTTRDADSYRILRLGRLSLAREIRGEVLGLRAGTSGDSLFHLKQILLTPVKTNE